MKLTLTTANGEDLQFNVITRRNTTPSKPFVPKRRRVINRSPSAGQPDEPPTLFPFGGIPEILYLILSETVLTSADLARCALINKAFSRAAAPILWESVEIKDAVGLALLIRSAVSAVVTAGKGKSADQAKLSVVYGTFGWVKTLLVTFFPVSPSEEEYYNAVDDIVGAEKCVTSLSKTLGLCTALSALQLKTGGSHSSLQRDKKPSALSHLIDVTIRLMVPQTGPRIVRISSSSMNVFASYRKWLLRWQGVQRIDYAAPDDMIADPTVQYAMGPGLLFLTGYPKRTLFRVDMQGWSEAKMKLLLISLRLSAISGSNVRQLGGKLFLVVQEKLTDGEPLAWSKELFGEVKVFKTVEEAGWDREWWARGDEIELLRRLDEGAAKKQQAEQAKAAGAREQ